MTMVLAIEIARVRVSLTESVEGERGRLEVQATFVSGSQFGHLLLGCCACTAAATPEAKPIAMDRNRVASC